MTGVNKALIIGNLGRDPEVRQTANGQRVANLSVATSERWTDKQSGERRERTEWHRVVVFDQKLVDVAESYLRKGSKVYVEGKLQTRKWQGQDGQDRYTTEIVLPQYQGVLQILSGGAGSSSGGDEQRQPGSQSQQNGGASGGAGAGQAAPASDDFGGMEDIPF